MAKIYLAARYSRIDELNFYKQELEARGHTVVSRWLNGTHQLHGDAVGVEESETTMPTEAWGFALDDYQDIEQADMFIGFTEPMRSPYSRGGRHVEFGLALAWSKRIAIIGPRENVFYTLPQVEHYGSFLEFTRREWGGLMKGGLA